MMHPQAQLRTYSLTDPKQIPAVLVHTQQFCILINTSPHAAHCALLCLQVKAKTQQLAALHATVALLRAVLQRLKLTAKLRSALADPTVGTSALDLAKVGATCSDDCSPGGKLA